MMVGACPAPIAVLIFVLYASFWKAVPAIRLSGLAGQVPVTGLGAAAAAGLRAGRAAGGERGAYGQARRKTEDSTTRDSLGFHSDLRTWMPPARRAYRLGCAIADVEPGITGDGMPSPSAPRKFRNTVCVVNVGFRCLDVKSRGQILLSSMRRR